MRTVFVVALALIVFAGAGLAQECCPGGTCEDCKSCESCPSTATLSAKIAKLEKKGEEAKLAELVKAANVKDVATLKTTVAEYEKYADCGCDASAEMLVKLAKVLEASPRAEPVALSAYLAQLTGYAENGCEQSKKILASVSADCGTECKKTMVAKIQKLEACAAKGCSKSATALAMLDAKIRPAPLSARVEKLVACSKGGCDKSKEIVAGLTEGRESSCCQKLVLDIKALEASAAKGDKESATVLAAMEKKLPAAKPVTMPDCTDCTACNGCSKKKTTG